jgi:hypothetical protein
MVGVPSLTGKQQLFTALLILACEPGGIEERLESAYRLAIVSIDPQLHMPQELSSEFADLRNELQHEYAAPRDSGFIVQRYRAQWASDMASRLIAFYDKLARL